MQVCILPSGYEVDHKDLPEVHPNSLDYSHFHGARAGPEPGRGECKTACNPSYYKGVVTSGRST